MELSPKYKSFLRHKTPVEFLEGTTFAGKTTVGIVKFICVCAASPKRLHVLSGLDNGTIEKNIILKDFGVLDEFGTLAEYYPRGSKRDRNAHILLKSPSGDKTIYVLGYADKARWKKALGGQYGAVYIDEINIADMDYVREISMRCDYLMGTLNPDNPDLDIYKEYINHSRPLDEWRDETPTELLRQLDAVPKDGWTHWYFSFEHNASLSESKKRQIVENVPVGTKLYKNKILGLRGRATGLVFNLEPRCVITGENAEKLLKNNVLCYSCGVDTSYSQKSDDTFAFVFTAVTIDRKCVVLSEKTINNRDLKKPVTPSDLPVILFDFLERNRAQWGFARNVFIDCADAATILECKKYQRSTGCAYVFQGAHKQTKIIDRINLQGGWLAHGDFLVNEDCRDYIKEMNSYSWQENKDEPEDGNDHAINACQYAWLPWKGRIGAKSEEFACDDAADGALEY